MAQVTTLHPNGVSGVPYSFSAKTPAPTNLVLWETDHHATLGEKPFARGAAVTGLPVLMIDVAGAAVTSGTVNGFIVADDGTQTALTNSPVHEGGGQWTVDLTEAEMDADVIGLLFSHTSAVPNQAWIRTR